MLISESDRLAALAGFGILDTPAEQAYDDIAQLASLLCGTPIALIGFTDATRQWYKAKWGFGATETPRELSFCAQALLEPENILLVPDAQQDPRFAKNPLVIGEPHIRFYAGVPLLDSQGHAIGTLCVIDQAPRSLSPEQGVALRALARQTMTLLELGKQAVESKREIARRLEAESQIRESEARFHAMNDASPIGVYVTSPNGDCVYVNERWEQITGMRQEEAKGDGWTKALYPEDREALSASWYTAAQNNAPFDEVYRFQRPSGDVVWIHGRATGMRGKTGELLGYVGAILDITERREAEIALQKSELMLQRAQKLAHIGSWELNLETGTGIWSEEMFAIHELEPASVPPHFTEYLGLVHPEDRERVRDHASTANTAELAYRLLLPSGRLRHVHVTMEVAETKRGKPALLRGILIDVTERVEAMQEIELTNARLNAMNQEMEAINAMMQEHILLVNEQSVALEVQKMQLEHANTLLTALATLDGLTGIANHRCFQERLSEEWERSQRYHNAFSVILLDVDNFKKYNDAFGHPEGDKVLKTVAQTLRESKRETDFVARYGGEEFVIILPETNEQGSREAAERFRNAIANQNWELRPITASFGVSTISLSCQSLQDLVAFADKALYESKRQGRNRVTHSNQIPEIAA